MIIGYMGLGKLGLPCALSTEAHGHIVVGYDPSPKVKDILLSKTLPYMEEGAQELLEKSEIRLIPVEDMVRICDIIFVPIQTPHDPLYEGITCLPEERKDFDYTYLVTGIKQIVEASKTTGRCPIVSIVSTVLPGTVDKYIKPLAGKHIKLCYNPYFIAMSTTIHDFENPEFVVLGVDDEKAAKEVEDFYSTIHNKPVYRTTIPNAELIKVAYNTFISMKLTFVNTLMEICEKTGADVDAVTDALKMGTDRLVSKRYLTAGMGDAGGCHPRDNIALSWLARELDLHYDIFSSIMEEREAQAEWFANTLISYDRPITILGYAYKPEVNLANGSHALLVYNIIKNKGKEVHKFDPFIDENNPREHEKDVFFIGCMHKQWDSYTFPDGSIVIDPNRYIPESSAYSVVHLGGRRGS